MTQDIDLRKLLEERGGTNMFGQVTDIPGLVIQARIPNAFMGEVCVIEPRKGEKVMKAEVVGFRHGDALLMPLGPMGHIGAGSEVRNTGNYFEVPVGEELLGRVLNGLGEPLKGDALKTKTSRAAIGEPPHPLNRKRIRNQLHLGIKAIDAMLPCGVGQRVGIFAAAGGGKSTLMSMIARNATADVKVIVLLGERGREVSEFIEDSLKEAVSSSVVVVATADQPAIVRLRAAYVGTTIAEYFRDQGKNVILMMDSITRFARAQREIGLSRGEPPARYGFPPSVFSELPKLFERCCNSTGSGSLTGFYTVLVEGDNLDEPVADETRSLLDGHIILSPKVHFRPSIKFLASESRVRSNLGVDIGKKATIDADIVWAFLRQYDEDESDIKLGFYAQGNAAAILKIKQEKKLTDEFMEQDCSRPGLRPDEIRKALDALAAKLPDCRAEEEKKKNPRVSGAI